MTCPRCQHENRATARFCEECAGPLKTASAVTRSHTDDLKAEVESLRQALTESFARQTATSEILRVISSSPTDVQPVFDAIARHAVALCGGVGGMVVRYDGAVMRLAAFHNVSAKALELHQTEYPRPPDRTVPLGAAIVDRTIVHVPNLQASTRFAGSPVQRSGRASMIAVPLLRQGEAIGAIGITRDEPEGFSDRDIALLQTFADQAVIAIENVRLFTELQEKNHALTQAHAQASEALEQQTATAEILRVISSSPTSLQPVLDAVAQNAARVCEGQDAAVLLVESTSLRRVANTGGISVTAGDVYALRRDTVMGRAVIDRQTVHVGDLLALKEEYPEGARHAAKLGHRTTLATPLLREGKAIGVLLIRRLEVCPFTDAQVTLLETFADQAVIAIENVRLFKELQSSNHELRVALDQQTASSEVLRIIASSPTDLQPVFDAIVRSAGRLCDSAFGALQLFDGEQITLDAHYGISPEDVALLQQRVFPMRPDRGSISGRAILTRALVHIEDVRADPDYSVPVVRTLEGYRTYLSAPMLRKDVVVGVINLWRPQVRPFSQTQIEMAQMFADQAVIAVENVRLFTELQENNRALTEAHAQVSESLEQQTATAEILRVISGSPTDLTPVFEAILANACRLCGATLAALWRVSGEELIGTASYNASPEFAEHMRRNPLVPSQQGPTRLAALKQRTVHIADMTIEPGFSPVSLHFEKARTVLSVPLLHDTALVGVLSMWRREVRPFTEQQIALVQTFADQAVIAIENVRLFTELQARTTDLTRSVDELRALSEVGQAISSTLDLRAVLNTIVGRATHLSGTDAGVIYEYDEQGEIFVPRATEHLEADIVETMLATPVRKGEGATGRLAEIHEPNEVPDILRAPAESRVRGALVRAGYRALLAVPLVREEHLLGGLTVIRKAAGSFAPEVIELLRTFATQSALAIQNARLFHEIEDKSRQLEAASQHKSEFLANMSHELRTPLNAIIGFSEVLGERLFGELNEKQEEYLKDIHASGQHLLSLINDILDLSKIEAGRMELELTDFDLPTAIDNALTLVRERAGRRDIALHQAADEGMGRIRGDERKIKQVLLNLLSNAIKFTPDAGRIDVRARAVDGSVEVSVSDTGVGIAPEDQEAIFEEFRQVGTADKKVEGTGLGLALSRKFIELHGGRIWVTSQVGAGSTFMFTLPVRHGE